jgi:hypothetical protein
LSQRLGDTVVSRASPSMWPKWRPHRAISSKTSLINPLSEAFELIYWTPFCYLQKFASQCQPSRLSLLDTL